MATNKNNIPLFPSSTDYINGNLDTSNGFQPNTPIYAQDMNKVLRGMSLVTTALIDGLMSYYIGTNAVNINYTDDVSKVANNITTMLQYIPCNNATSATSADGFTQGAVGSQYVPIYFNAKGKPIACDTKIIWADGIIYDEESGNGYISQLSIASISGDKLVPLYFESITLKNSSYQNDYFKINFDGSFTYYTSGKTYSYSLPTTSNNNTLSTIQIKSVSFTSKSNALSWLNGGGATVIKVMFKPSSESVYYDCLNYYGKEIYYPGYQTSDHYNLYTTGNGSYLIYYYEN